VALEAYPRCEHSTQLLVFFGIPVRHNIRCKCIETQAVEPASALKFGAYCKSLSRSIRVTDQNAVGAMRTTRLAVLVTYES
jgi:hypothetical protein